MRKSRKYLLIVITGFILLIAISLLFTQTSFFKEQVKKKLIEVVETQLNLKLEIEKLEGNFFSHLTFKNLKFSHNDSTVALFPSVNLGYGLWGLTNGVIVVDSVIIESPQINIWQNNDSIWNLSTFSKPKNKSISKSTKPFNFLINAKHVAITNGSVLVSSFSKLIPRRTKQLNLVVKGSYNKSETYVHLQKFDFITENPSLVLNELSGIYKMNEDGIQVDSVRFRSGGSNIDIQGNYLSKENMNSKVDASRIDNKELAIFIPSFKLLCSPSLKADFTVSNDSVSAQAELLYNNQSLKAEVSLDKLVNLLSKKDAVPYYADLNFHNFILEDWIETNNQSALLDGNIQLKGTNLLNPKSLISISANLGNSEYKSIVFDTFTFDGTYAQDSLNANMNVYSAFGKVQINGVLNNISGLPKYKATLVSHAFNLSAFLPELKNTNINGIIRAQGTGFTADDLFAEAELHLTESSVYMVPIDTLYANVHIDNLNLNIDSLQLYVPGGSASGNGKLSLDSLRLQTLISANINSAELIDSFYVLPITFDSLTTVTSLSGPLQSLEIGGDVEIFNAKGYSTELEKANAQYLVSLKTDSLNVHVNTTAYQVSTGPAEWDTANVDFNYTKENIDLAANVIWNDTANVGIITRFTIGDTMAIDIPKFEAKTLLSDYYLPDTMHVNIYNQEKFDIENFRIKDQNQEDFILAANGIISTADSNNFEVVVNQFDLSQLNKFIGKENSIKGIFETKMSVSGTSQNPSIVGFMEIGNPTYGKYTLSSLSSNFNYTNQIGFAELTSPDMENSFNASINATFKASIDSLKFIFTPPETFNGTLLVDSLELSKVADRFIPNDSISGIVQGKIEANGDFNNPLFFGELDITDGHYVNKNLGLDYNHIQTSVVFDGKKILLDTILVRQKDGLISLTGNVEFDSTLIKGTIKSSSLQIDANQFFLTKHRNYEVLIDANTFVKTEKLNPEFGGKIKVIRSDVYLPALIPDDKADFEKDVPLLIAALSELGDSTELVVNTSLKKTTAKSKQSRLLETLTGRLNIEIPRNTWIKNDDMRLELSGNVDIAKTGSFFEIFGNIDVIRGHYILYGRKLNIKESQIIFQGGEELDPVLNIATEYVYRGSDKEKRYLELLINGKVSEPDITFILDGAEITETDGISILIFGATSDEIGYGDQNGMLSSVSSNAVAGIISSQLSRTIGTQLKLDMIEITATESWQSAAFVVGKYITNDIFVVYERGFGEVEGDEITPETITIEYEINDKLFLRLQSGSSTTSGVDVILKFEQDRDKITPATNKK